MKKNYLLLFIGAPLFSILLIALRIYYSAVVWKYEGEDFQFTIKPNENFSSINGNLKKNKLIHSSRLFHRYCQYKGLITSFKPGNFIIKQNSNFLDVIDTLTNTHSKINLFTIPEGKNMYEIGKMLAVKKIVNYNEFIHLAKDQNFLKELNINSDSIEGHLYPDSYDFSENQGAKSVLSTMAQLFNKKISELDFSNTNLKLEEVVTLASMVEKETGDQSERPIIAGVFFNRLKLKMRLQSDPTTIYGIFENYKGNLTKKDLLTPSPYNTYTLAGLPKGPIANPGIQAIKAVLNPSNHKYLFFVSQNEGRHFFSENYSDHAKAVNTWQKDAKNREGKSWRNKTQ